METAGRRGVEVKFDIGCANRRFEFKKNSQLFIGMHNETFSFATMCLVIKIVRRSRSTIHKNQNQTKL